MLVGMRMVGHMVALTVMDIQVGRHVIYLSADDIEDARLAAMTREHVIVLEGIRACEPDARRGSRDRWLEHY